MRGLIEPLLKGQAVDYIEVRIEEVTANRLSYQGRDLDSIGRSFSIGGNVRAAHKGGWGFVSFNDLNKLQDAVALAVKQAQLTGSEETLLAPVIPVVEIVPPNIKKDPVAVPLNQKKALFDEYNNLIWHTPQIQTSNISYGDIVRRMNFCQFRRKLH